MRILGILVGKMNRLVAKNLRTGWYPFGNYLKPLDGGYVRLNDAEEQKRAEVNRKLYHLEGENTPDINVCCVAGKNGSGKSTLLDLMFRILNNLSFTLLINRKVTSIVWANGVNAALHFETDNIPGYISNIKENVKIYWGYDNNGNPKELNSDEVEMHDVLHHLFYTICINYSIYSFHVKDYNPPMIQMSILNQGINGKWLEKLFHKNDGYLMPIVLAPFRDRDGNINIGRESKLAKQRLTTLILFFHLNNKQFIDGYYPNELSWAYDKDYLIEAIENLNNNWLGYSKMKLEHKIGQFYQRWATYFECQDMPKTDVGISMRKVVLRYLSYKSLKICTIYSDYAAIYKSKSKKISIKLDEVIYKILTELDHITVKIHQCLHFANGSMYSELYSHKDVTTLFNHIGTVNSYDEMMRLLPPSFFIIDLDMRKMKQKPEHLTAFGLGERFSLGSMSSGERQFLNSISYALYHIKNLEGIRDGHNRVHYKHINLVLDEAELYYHPEYQRRYVKMLLETLSWCNFTSDKIRSINIIIVTHSPFILSDIVNDNVLYLENGTVKKQQKETFGANYYDLLYNSFFFEKNAIGEIATEVISELIKHPEEMTEALKDILGDPIIRGYLINKKEGYVSHQTER